MKKIFRFLLFPFTLLYIFFVEIRNLFFDMGVLPAKQMDIPVICVGNLNTGGTGKSPMVDYLLKLLSKQFKVVALSRGYGRTSKGFVEVKSTSTTAQVGDEPLMLKQNNLNNGVFVDENRVVGIQKIIAEHHPAAIVLDDAFQHRYVKAGLNIVLTVYNDFFYNDFVLPSGNLRELRKNAERANMVVVTKCPVSMQKTEMDEITQKIKRYTTAHVFFAGLVYADLVPAFAQEPLVAAPKTALVVTGIASGDALVNYCSTVYQQVEHIAYADHWNYKHTDIVSIAQKFNSFAAPDKVLVTTHKDIVKWKELGEASMAVLKALPVFYQPVEVVILNNPDGFNLLINDYVSKNKSNS